MDAREWNKQSEYRQDAEGLSTEEAKKYTQTMNEMVGEALGIKLMIRKNRSLTRNNGAFH